MRGFKDKTARVLTAPSLPRQRELRVQSMEPRLNAQNETLCPLVIIMVLSHLLQGSK